MSPEAWYRLFWIAVEVLRAIVLIALARALLVQPLITAITSATDRIVACLVRVHATNNNNNDNHHRRVPLAGLGR